MQSYRQALALGAQGSEEIHLNCAAIYAEHMGRHDEAERELTRALQLRADYVPALLSLGSLHEQRGARTAARDTYLRALRIHPQQPVALARLATLQTLERADDPLFDALRGALRNPRMTPVDRAELGFALGKALDDVGAYDEAFAAYVAANAASRSVGPGARYDRAAHERSVDDLVAAFAGPADGAPVRAADEPRLLFICGMFRSGSTLVERILGTHPEVTAGGEIDLLPALVRQTFGPLPRRYRALDDAETARWRATYLDGVKQLHPASRVLTDKRPDNFLHIGLIKRLFPDALIVHTMRQPLDNCLSVFFLHLSHSMSYALDLNDIAHWYGQYRRLMAHWHRLYGNDLFTMDYDRLVHDPRNEIGSLLTFAGLPWDERCLTFHESGGIVATPSAWQVRRPLYTASSGRWRHYAAHLGGLQAALAPWLSEAAASS